MGGALTEGCFRPFVLSWDGVNESRRHLPFLRTKMKIHLQDFGVFFLKRRFWKTHNINTFNLIHSCFFLLKNERILRTILKNIKNIFFLFPSFFRIKTNFQKL